MGNSLVFRKPIPTYNNGTFQSKLNWIEKQSDEIEQSSVLCGESKLGIRKIPFLYFKHFLNKHENSRVIIYFHANSEDIGITYKLLENIHFSLKIDVISVEYPGYGIYKGEPSEQQINEDALFVYQYILNNFGGRYKKENVFAAGRSIGTGPAVYLASNVRNIGGVILISPFRSIKQIVEERVGGIAAKLMPDIYKNEIAIRNIFCPILIIHGSKDILINVDHAKELFKLCPSQRKKLVIREDMEHNKFQINLDIIPALEDFFDRIFSQSRLFHSIKIYDDNSE